MESNETVEESSKNIKILAINSGGTIGMIKVGTELVPPERGHFYRALRDKLGYSNFGTWPNSNSFHLTHEDKTENITKIIRIDLEETDNLLDSADMSYDQWSEIAQIIKDKYDDYDGFVVIHGTDTMVYGASALSFMFENLSKPIVFTGAQIPMYDARSDGWNNLISSFIVASAQDNLPVVSICFNSKVYMGNRCIKQDSDGFDAYTSGDAPLVTLGTRITFRRLDTTTGTLAVRCQMEKNVKQISVYPEMQARDITSLWDKAHKYKGAVLVSYGAGNIPDDMVKFVQQACEKEILIVNVTQCHKGGVATDYRSGNKLMAAGVVFGGDMTPAAALMKLSYILGRYAGLSIVEKKRKFSVILCNESEAQIR
ncbi:L-asparaginase 1-like [Physella acuta]|uniref:L-asparaginase 1-like n=1 Tax=Physella acuta TaxID=109671 RepID=UPI0027DDACAE|nr:L-asparaginase 1-like [Physella acuta]